MITIQKVSCPLSYFQNEGLSLAWLSWFHLKSNGKTTVASLEWTFRNHRVPIVKVRAKVGNGQFFDLIRSWTNKFMTKMGDPLYDTRETYTLEGK